jgi:hypothetical protein
MTRTKILLCALGAVLVACSDHGQPSSSSAGASGGKAPSGGAAGTAGACCDQGTGGSAAGSTAGDSAVGAAGTGPIDAGDSDGGATGVVPTEVTATIYELVPVTPPWVAYQDGDGAWQRLTGDDGVFKFQVKDQRYGIAVACDELGERGQSVKILHATVAETVAPRMDCAVDAANPTDSVSGTVRGVPPGYGSSVTVLWSTDFLDTGNGDYRLTTRSGLRDVVAAQGMYFTPMGTTLHRLILLRDREISSTGTAFDFDFAAQGFDLTGTGEGAVAGVASGEGLSTDVTYETPRRTGLSLFSGNAPTFAFPLIPEAERRTGDLYAISAYASSAVQTRSATTFRVRSSTVELSLPPANSTSAVDLIGTSPYIRFTATLPHASDAAWFEVRYSNFADNAVRSWSSIVTPGWVSSQRTYSLPDLNAVAGWDNSRGLVGASTPIGASVTVVRHSLGIGGFLGGTVDPEGIEVKRSQQHFTITP